MKKTPWFTGVDPIRVGVYQRRYRWGISYAYFDGNDWGLAADTIQGANNWGISEKRALSGFPWRGLTIDDAKTKGSPENHVEGCEP